MTESFNRRQFVQAAASSAAVLAPALRASGRQAPSHRVRIGLIGCGGRGRELLEVFGEFPDVEVAAVSDVIEPRMDQAAKILASGPSPQQASAVRPP